jgi:hypothetical protein
VRIGSGEETIIGSGDGGQSIDRLERVVLRVPNVLGMALPTGELPES